MTLDEAMAILTQVCALYRGTLKEHKLIQEALAVVERRVTTEQGSAQRQHMQEGGTA